LVSEDERCHSERRAQPGEAIGVVEHILVERGQLLALDEEVLDMRQLEDARSPGLASRHARSWRSARHR
jgi:hypothetical protein